MLSSSPSMTWSWGSAHAGADPVDQNLQAVPGAAAGEVVHVHRQVGEEGGAPGELVAADFADRLAASRRPPARPCRGSGTAPSRRARRAGSPWRRGAPAGSRRSPARAAAARRARRPGSRRRSPRSRGGRRRSGPRPTGRRPARSVSTPVACGDGAGEAGRLHARRPTRPSGVSMRCSAAVELEAHPLLVDRGHAGALVNASRRARRGSRRPSPTASR